MNILIKSFRNLLVPISVIFGSFASVCLQAQEPPDRPVMNKPPESNDATKSQRGTKDRPTSVDVPVLTVVPAQVTTDLEKKGCWAKFYGKKNYEGDSLMLTGPASIARMTGPFGFDWENKVRSLKVGPRANLTIYDNRDFRDQDKFIDARTNVADMSSQMGFFDDFRSVMLSCI
jgi:hypothetical protein